MIAHRGASGTFPENTEIAVQEAHKLGADIIEIDIQMTRDGQLVLFHDWNLLRIANSNKTVPEMTYEQLSQVDIGSHHDERYRNLRIQKLEDILSTHPNLDFIIEIKKKYGDNKTHQFFISKLLDLLNIYNYRPNKGYISVRDFITYDMLVEVSDIRVGVMQKKRTCKEYHELIHQHNVKIAQIRWLNYDEEMFTDLQSLVNDINAFPADTPQEWSELNGWGVTGILTNYPGKLRKWLSSSI